MSNYNKKLLGGILDFLITQIKKQRIFFSLFSKIAQRIYPENIIVLDYPINSKQRWSKGNPHHELHDIIKNNRAIYEYHLRSFLLFIEYFISIPERQTKDLSSPFWINEWTPALDGVALYSFLAINKPKYYIEIGSGISTRFARRAINDHKLSTEIISIDPCPRYHVNNICDKNIREPVENINLDIFDRLDVNDILYVDNSHRVFMNSDTTVILLEVIPRLKPGVLVGIHDVMLPYDYPSDWNKRYYSEQYLLAAYLLAKGNRFDIVLPSAFISHESEMKSILSPLWEKEEMKNTEKHGSSFWIRLK